MINEYPFVSIIIPCRNEGKFIGKCLDTILEQDYPKENLEILVVDGMSEDKTREIARNYSEKYPFIKLLENSKKFTNFAFNMGIKASKGEVIMIMGTHAGYEKDYISKCVRYLNEYNADNVGGIIKTIPSKNTLCARAITISLSHIFGVGGSYFRTGSKEPKWVDTVFGGCYKKEVFDEIGLFNENLLRSQDMELNIRLKKAGGKILLHPDIIAYYYPKDNLKDFFVHNVKDGIWTVYPLKFVKTSLRLRHYIPLILVLTLPLSIWPYIIISLLFSFMIAVREKDIRLFFIMPLVFGVRHIGYGLGSIWGIIKLLF
jgi:glycosyltransferase involved in cell wall biosynthesis